MQCIIVRKNDNKEIKKCNSVWEANEIILSYNDDENNYKIQCIDEKE